MIFNYRLLFAGRDQPSAIPRGRCRKYLPQLRTGFHLVRPLPRLSHCVRRKLSLAGGQLRGLEETEKIAQGVKTLMNHLTILFKNFNSPVYVLK